MSEQTEKRLKYAKDIVLRCIGPRGLYAGTYRYKYQYWTRDFTLAGLYALLSLGQIDVIKRHLLNTARRQKKSGKIPIMFLQTKLGFASIHFKDWIGHPLTFVDQLRIYFKKGHLMGGGFSFSDITPWTNDGETLFIIGCIEYVNATGDREFLDKVWPNIQKAIQYIEKHIIKHGLVFGGDWRDVMPNLDYNILLSNNALLYRAYVLLEEAEKAETVKKLINDLFWTGSYYRDSLGSEDFDTLGQSLAIIYDIVPEQRFAAILEKYKEINSQYGYRTNNNVPDRSLITPRIQKLCDQFGTVWPFIAGFGILALIKMGQIEEAKKQFMKWPGFHEWYDPESGKGLGDKEQLWSAAMYLRVYDTLSPYLS